MKVFNVIDRWALTTFHKNRAARLYLRLKMRVQMLKMRLEPQRSSVGKTFSIPDLSRPIPERERGAVGSAYHLVPFTPRALEPDELAGRLISEWSHLGTYGMGGYGYLGLRLGEDWLVIAIFGAPEWVTFDGRPISWNAKGNPPAPPWLSDDDDRLAPTIVGARIATSRVERTSMEIVLEDGRAFAIDADPRARPRFPGTGGRRVFLADDDLRRAVFLSPTDEIWS